MTQPYAVSSTGPVLIQSVTAFLDALGTTATSQDQRLAQERLVLLYDAYHSPMVRELLAETVGYRVSTFTDNVVIGVPIDLDDDRESELGRAFVVIAAYQFELAIRGVFIRGGVAIGDLFMDDGFVYGPALADSYQIESKEAIVPRVLLDAEAASLARQHIVYYASPEISPQYAHLLVDEDDRIFLNYLESALEYEDPRHALLTHRDRVNAELLEHATTRTIHSKYLWVASYHNWFCANVFPDDPDLCIKIQDVKTLRRIA